MATPNLGIPTLTEGATNSEATANSALLRLDGVVSCRVEDRDLTAPPGSPSEGDTYIVGASATGDWAGQDATIAIYTNAAWVFVTPVGGQTIFVHDEKLFMVYSSQESLWYAPGNIWTTTETWSGQYGSGGTKLYTKVIDIGALPNATTKNTAHSITSIAVTQYIGIDGYAQDGTDVAMMPLAFYSSAVRTAAVFVNATNVRVETQINLSGWSGKIRLFYERTA